MLAFSTEQIAVLDAALRRGQIEDVYEVWNVCRDVLEAEIASRIAAADLTGATPRFDNVGCSECGRRFGPGNAGFSHCTDHIGRRALDD